MKTLEEVLDSLLSKLRESVKVVEFKDVTEETVNKYSMQSYGKIIDDNADTINSLTENEKTFLIFTLAGYKTGYFDGFIKKEFTPAIDEMIEAAKSETKDNILCNKEEIMAFASACIMTKTPPDFDSMEREFNKCFKKK